MKMRTNKKQEKIIIDIDNKKGVSTIGKDTKLLAKHAKSLKFKSAIDIGVGTGFIPIYLRKLGLNCQGTDINPLALNCAKKNAKKNNVQVNFYNSNLFDNINEKFDLIIFNPPYGNSNPHFFNKILEIVKSFSPKENVIVSKISFQLVKKQRRILINDFLNKVNLYLNDKGQILMQLNRSEMYLVRGFTLKILDKIKVGNSHIVLLDKQQQIKTYKY